MGKAGDAARLTKAFPQVDILVNNVGTFMAKEFAQSTDQDWETIYLVNVLSGVRLSRACLPGMKPRRKC